MCQMIIHAHAQTTTMLQALAHNLATSSADLGTLVPILRNRDHVHPEDIEVLDRMRGDIDEIHATLMDLFGAAVREDPHVDGGACGHHPDREPEGVTVATVEHIHA